MEQSKIKYRFRLKLNVDSWGSYVKGDIDFFYISLDSLIRFPIDRRWDIESVDVFTGRIDKHDNELYNNDIVRFSTTISEGIDQIIWDEKNCCFTTTKHGSHVMSDDTEFESLGTIYEDKHLLIY